MNETKNNNNVLDNFILENYITLDKKRGKKSVKNKRPKRN